MAMASNESAVRAIGHDEDAATYRVRPGVARVYVASGLLMCVVAAVVLIVRPASFGKAYFNVLFYLAAVAIAVLSLLRFKTCRLTLSDEELFFYNGIIDTRRIPVSQIERVEYNPQIRIRIYVRRQGNRTALHRLPNVFSAEDTQAILGRLEAQGIEVDYIEKPGKDEGRASGQAVAEQATEENLNG